MKTGAIILTSGKRNSNKSFEPMLEVGSISVVKTLIKTLQKSDISPIVVLTDSKELKSHISRFNIILIESNDSIEMFDFIKKGLNFIMDKTDKVLISPIDTPLFKSSTVKKLLNSEKECVNPVYKNQTGHPVIIKNSIIPSLLNYKGGNGLKGALNELGIERDFIKVDDLGVIFKPNYNDTEIIKKNTESQLYPSVKIKIVKDEAFFGPGAANLLSLIKESNSVRLACKYMTLSYSKGWKIINLIEEQLGYKVVERQQGGKNGGYANLTGEGEELLYKYKKFEAECKELIQIKFQEIFKTYDNSN